MQRIFTRSSLGGQGGPVALGQMVRANGSLSQACRGPTLPSPGLGGPPARLPAASRTPPRLQKAAGRAGTGRGLRGLGCRCCGELPSAELPRATRSGVSGGLSARSPPVPEGLGVGFLREVPAASTLCSRFSGPVTGAPPGRREGSAPGVGRSGLCSRTWSWILVPERRGARTVLNRPWQSG